MKRITALFVAILVGLATPSLAQQAPSIDPKAEAVLKRMSDFLGGAKSVSFEAHAINDQLTPEGQKIQYAKNQKVTLSRPDKLAADVTGDNEDLQFRYDGKTVTLYNPRTKSFGSTEAPKTIEETLDMLAAKFGVAIPLADLVFSDPYKCLTENVRSGQYIGMGYVFGTECFHLAFRQSAVDWQIWIDAGAKPLPRKVVITFKESPGHLQYTAFLDKWNLTADANDAMFTFTPPADAKKVDFAPAKAPAGEK
jgi:hypothetical protein